MSEFSIRRKNKDGHLYTCKVCRNKEKRESYILHPERVKEWNDRSVAKRLEKCKQYRHNYYLLNIEKFKKIGKEKYLAYREEIKKRTKKWAVDNPDKVKEYSKRKGLKRRSTPIGKLNQNISFQVYDALKNRKVNCHWETLVNFTLEDLILHLERQFTGNMSWDNYGQWHVDHKIPKAIFSFSTPTDPAFLQCWALDNLQPLWARDNLSKGAKYGEM